jgi:hypothetical protein
MTFEDCSLEDPFSGLPGIGRKPGMGVPMDRFMLPPFSVAPVLLKVDVLASAWMIPAGHLSGCYCSRIEN